MSCLIVDEFLCAVCVTTRANPSAFAGYLSGKESKFKNCRFLCNFVFNQPSMLESTEHNEIKI